MCRLFKLAHNRSSVLCQAGGKTVSEEREEDAGVKGADMDGRKTVGEGERGIAAWTEESVSSGHLIQDISFRRNIRVKTDKELEEGEGGAEETREERRRRETTERTNEEEGRGRP